MNYLSNLSIEDTALIISLLDNPKFSFVMDFIKALINENNPGINAQLNVHLPLSKQATPDIINWKRSQPFGMAYLIGQSAILKTQGYELNPIEGICTCKCQKCNQKTAISLIYAKRNQITDTVDFEICLSCYTTYKMTPVYASAEQEV